MINRTELRAIIKEVVRELQEERRASFSERLAKARIAKTVKREAAAKNAPGGVVISRQKRVALDVLRSIEPATAREWKDQFEKALPVSAEAARKAVARAIPQLLEAGLVQEGPDWRFRVVQPGGD